MIKVLFEGVHENTYHKGWYKIHPLTCSVTLIKTKNHNILFDTGTLAYRTKLLSELARENLEPKDIDIIFNSHFHLDHVSNNTVFFNAKQFSEHAAFDLKTNTVEIFTDKSLMKEKIPKDVEYFETPGHFHGHMSLKYSENGKNHVMSGDIVREDIIRGTGYSAGGVSKEAYESMKKVFEKADVIIPGHGRVIEGKLFKELKDILYNEFPKKHGFES